MAIATGVILTLNIFYGDNSSSITSVSKLPLFMVNILKVYFMNHINNCNNGIYKVIQGYSTGNLNSCPIQSLITSADLGVPDIFNNAEHFDINLVYYLLIGALERFCRGDQPIQINVVVKVVMGPIHRRYP